MIGQRESAVDQDVESVLLHSDAVEQSGYLTVVGVIHLHGDPGTAASGDLCGCLADRAGQLVLTHCRRATGDIHGGTAVTEGRRGAFADAVACSGDEGAGACQRDHSVVSSVAEVQRSSKNPSL